MKRIRITWFKAVDNAKIPGIGGQAGSSTQVYDGFQCSTGPLGGGGQVAAMYLVDGAIRVYKKDAKGEPHRCFGTSPRAGGKGAQVIGDFIDIPTHMTTGYVGVWEECEGEQQQDPPPAKPAQNPQRR